MNPQKYIEAQLEKMKESSGISQPKDTDVLQAEVLRLLLSKKFRKYSANEELIEHCKKAIALNMAKNEPLNITFVCGAYKLWRLEESPHADWAELFALMYYTNWMKDICAIYKPGVHFDFFVDDWIIPKLDNVPSSDVDTYIKSFNALLIFLKPYQSNNLNMTVTPVGTQFKSKKDFDALLNENLKKLNEAGLPELDDTLRATIELNVKTTPEQESDSKWREKVWQLHLAYMPVKASPGYHKQPNKIVAFTQPLPSGTTVSVGTTKSSVMKFWVGAGLLKCRDTSYIETILSPSQLKSGEFEKSAIAIDGLTGTNFDFIRTLK